MTVLPSWILDTLPNCTTPCFPFWTPCFSYCDKCSQSVDQLIQCESCEVWFCGACESIPAHTMEIIIAYNQVHWFCHACNAQADQLIQKLQTSSSDQSHSTVTISQIVTESLNKVADQFTKALKDVKD